MTIKESLIAALGMPADDMLVDKALIDNELTGTAAYTKDMALQVENAAIDILLSLKSQPDVSEGGFSVRYDRKAIDERIAFLAKKNGRDDIISANVPTVKGISPW